MTIEHRPACSRPSVITFTGKHGDELARCERCGRHEVLTHAPANPPTSPRPVPMSYRCREHPDNPVSWRGKGCADCAQERAARHATKRKTPTTTEEYYR